jgi:hypothetical protein
LHQCIRPLIGARCAPGHRGYQRACVLMSGRASPGPFGSPGFVCAGKTDPSSRSILAQTSAGNRLWGYIIADSSLRSVPTALSTARGSSRSGRCLSRLATLEGASRVENRPGDARQLVGERDRQHVGVQPSLGRFDPGFEPGVFPALDPDQHNPGRLHEERAGSGCRASRSHRGSCGLPSRPAWAPARLSRASDGKCDSRGSGLGGTVIPFG